MIHPFCKHDGCDVRTDNPTGVCRDHSLVRNQIPTAYMPQSKSDVHLTPDKVYDIIERQYNIQRIEFFDPCPLNPKFDGLNIEWQKYNFINPPYTKPDFESFIYKAIDESKIGNTSILLLPTKTDQKWFHNLQQWYHSIVWLQGRLRFDMLKCNFDGCVNIRQALFTATQPHFLIKIDGTTTVTGYLESLRDIEK